MQSLARNLRQELENPSCLESLTSAINTKGGQRRPSGRRIWLRSGCGCGGWSER